MLDDTATPDAAAGEQAAPAADEAAQASPAETQSAQDAGASEVPAPETPPAAPETAPDPLAQAQEELMVQRAANEALVRKLNEANAKLARIAELARLD